MIFSTRAQAAADQPIRLTGEQGASDWNKGGEAICQGYLCKLLLLTWELICIDGSVRNIKAPTCLCRIPETTLT